MDVQEILEEINEQIESMHYIKERQEFFEKHSMMHETSEYVRGALNMLEYLKQYIELHSSERHREIIRTLSTNQHTERK